MVRAGMYRSRVTIPPDFLPAGTYDLEFHAGIMSVRSLMTFPIRVQIDVHSSGRVNRAYAGYGTRGVIAPLLSWETMVLQEASPTGSF